MDNQNITTAKNTSLLLPSMSLTFKRPVGDPKSWSTHKVKGWLQWLSNRFNLNITAEMHESFDNVDGKFRLNKL